MNINGIMSGLLQNLICSMDQSAEVLQNKTAAANTPLQTELVKNELILYIDKAVSEILDKTAADIGKFKETLKVLPEQQQTEFSALFKDTGPALAKVKEGTTALYTSTKAVAEALNTLAAEAAAKGKASVSHQLQELATVYEKHCEVHVVKGPEHTALSLTIPLYVGDENSIYPAHIHIYREHENEKRVSAECETWVRLTVDTENLGKVNIVATLKNNQLNVKINPNEQFKKIFVQHLPDLQQKLDDENFIVQDIQIV